MTYTTASKFSPYPTIPESVIETIQRAHLVTAEWKIPHIEPFKEFHPLLHTAQKIAAQQVETLAALQRIPQMTVNQALLGQSAKMTAIVQSLHTSIAASGIKAALETSEAMRNIPVEQMRHLLTVWRPSCGLFAFPDNAPSVVPPLTPSVAVKHTSRHPRKRQIRKAAKKEFLSMSNDVLCYLHQSAPDVLESTKKFFQSAQFECFFFVLSGGKDSLTSCLSMEEKEVFDFIWFISIVLIALFKYRR